MNIVVICSDTFRYDHLGFLGRQPVRTPNLDRLAAESACFSDFQVCSFPTLVNRIEVFSGRYTFPLMDWGPLPFQFPVLAEVFRRNGFRTGLIADNLHLMQEGFGFGRGFDFVKNVPGQMHDHFQPPTAPMIELPCPEAKLEPPANRLARYRRNAWWYRQQGTNTTETVFRESMRWLDEAPAKFFLWIDAFDPHEPWDAPKQFVESYPWNQAGDAVFWPHSGKSDHYSEADLANMRTLYKGEVSQTDHWIGQLLDHLRRNNRLADTAILFCSDHGYYFGEHGLLGKPLKRRTAGPTTIYEELGHLPLLLRHPDGLSAGKTMDGLCQPPDLFPTLLELAGIPRVDWLQGNSLVPRLQGRAGRQTLAVGGCHPRKGNVSRLTVLTEEWCLIYSPAEGLAGSELYDRKKDPSQKINVIAEHGAVAEELFSHLRTWFDTLKVPPARQRQLLRAEHFNWWHRLQHRFWLWRNHRFYWRRFGSYDRR
jgi:arylsulfatase A-like enzyme